MKNESYTLEKWVLEFLKKYKYNDLKITTFNSYMQVYRSHILNSTIGKLKLENVNTEKLQKFYNEKLKKYSSKYVRSIEVVINSALDKAFQLRLIGENPNAFTTIPKKMKYEAKVLSREEVERILTEAKYEKLYPIVVTTLYTGMRKGEVMALKWENVDFENTKEDIIFRIIQETMTNALRHGHASHIEIHLFDEEEKYMIIMQDNGSGCKEIHYGYGLKQMHERVAILNGTIHFYSEEGFRTVVEIPKIGGKKR
mgnify:CR=1 FL=1